MTTHYDLGAECIESESMLPPAVNVCSDCGHMLPPELTITPEGHGLRVDLVTPHGSMHIYTGGELSAAYHVGHFLDTIDPQDNEDDEGVVH